MLRLLKLKLFKKFVNSSWLLLGIVAIATLACSSQAIAASPTISHNYQEYRSIPNGSIVSLDTHNSSYVQPANTNNGSRLIGVTLPSNQSLLAIDPNNAEIEVATSGTVTTLVSTLDGNISVGDQVAVSALAGVGMKALPGSQVIGLADASFTSTSNDVTSQTIKDTSGKVHTVVVGYIPVTIAITVVPTGSNGNSGLSSLQKFAQSFTGHITSTARIILALAVAAITLVILAVLIYASIYGSIISIGRNPLAKFAIMRSLASVLRIAVLMIVLAGLVIFLLLY